MSDSPVNEAAWAEMTNEIASAPRLIDTIVSKYRPRIEREARAAALAAVRERVEAHMPVVGRTDRGPVVDCSCGWGRYVNVDPDADTWTVHFLAVDDLSGDRT